jgi:hypothetical protein
MIHPKDPFIMYQTLTKWLWNPNVDKPMKIIVGIGT